MGLLRLWFGLSVEVKRVSYAVTGLCLMLFKYASEAILIHTLTGRFFSPLTFLNPLLTMRQDMFAPPAPPWLQWGVLVWTLPFLWISISMSVRRSANTGASPWLGLLVLVPGINYLLMMILCFIPPSQRLTWKTEKVTPEMDRILESALFGIVAGIGIALGMVVVGVYFLEEYGATMLLGTPIVLGAASAFIYNRPLPRSLGTSLAVSQVAILVSGAAMLLFAFEGIICLAMLYPFAAALGLLGGFVGYTLAALTRTRGRSLGIVLLCLPLVAAGESLNTPTPVYEVVTTIEIDAAPEEVWPHVIGFTELPAPPQWYFRLGIAYPQRATIEGTGVGAVRRCEFSTGAFVEPITVWDPPRKLGFDVESQPPPMHELSPYRHVHPPHLDGYLRSQRGEFRLIPLPGGRTRLEGSTWYEFEMYPQDYWTIWSDGCIHQIHRRVLAHIKQLAEKDAAQAKRASR